MPHPSCLTSHLPCQGWAPSWTSSFLSPGSISALLPGRPQEHQLHLLCLGSEDHCHPTPTTRKFPCSDSIRTLLFCFFGPERGQRVPFLQGPDSQRRASPTGGALQHFIDSSLQATEGQEEERPAKQDGLQRAFKTDVLAMEKNGMESAPSGRIKIPATPCSSQHKVRFIRARKQFLTPLGTHRS